MKEATKRPYPYTGSISHRYTATPRASKETANANDGKAAPSHLELDVRDLAEKGLAAIADKRKGVMERKQHILSIYGDLYCDFKKFELQLLFRNLRIEK